MPLIFKCSVLIVMVLLTTGRPFAIVEARQPQTVISHFDKISVEINPDWARPHVARRPAYSVTILEDGTVDYEGLQMVKTLGHQPGLLSGKQLVALRRAFIDADFLSLRDKYESAEDGCPTFWEKGSSKTNITVPDSSAAIITLEVDGKKKSVRHSFWCREAGAGKVKGALYPQALPDLENAIDRIIATDQWTGLKLNRDKPLPRVAPR
jgi:hypothetical protein